MVSSNGSSLRKLCVEPIRRQLANLRVRQVFRTGTLFALKIRMVESSVAEQLGGGCSRAFALVLIGVERDT